MDTKKLLTAEEAATLLGIDKKTLDDLINCGDLPAVGSQKNLVKLSDLLKFIGEVPSDSPTEFAETRHPARIRSVLIEDILESEWEEMQKKGTKEHKPYFNEQKQKWCIALSLGKNAEGKRIRKIISAATQAELWDAYREYISQQIEVAPIPNDAPIVKEGMAGELGLATYLPHQDILFRECFRQYLNGLESSIVNRTFDGYIYTSKYILKKLGHLKMYEINRAVISGFLTDLRNAKYARGKEATPTRFYSQSKIDKTFILLHSFIKSCSDESIGTPILAKDYMAGMKKPRTQALKPEDIIPCTPEEIMLVLDAVSSDKMIHCWVHIMAELGCRPSEALALKWRDINYDKGTISITDSLGRYTEFDEVTHEKTAPSMGIIKDLKNETGRSNTRNYQRRTLRVSEKTLEVIRNWQIAAENDKKLTKARKQNGTEEYLFTGDDGGIRVYEHYSKKYIRLLGKAGLSGSEFNPYRFRHTVCTELLRRGVDLKTVQLILGDNTPNVVLSVYANMQEKDILSGTTALSDRMVSIVGEEMAN